MSYATVKSDPWKKGLQTRRRRTGLWTEKQWCLLAATAHDEAGFKWKEANLKKLIDTKSTFEQFFQKAKLNPNARLITGVICGYRVEDIENPLTQQVRYLDKLVDELAKGRKMEKILRSE